MPFANRAIKHARIKLPLLPKRRIVIYTSILLLIVITLACFILPPLFYPQELLNAAREGHLDVVRNMLDKGVDINTKDGWDSTPMMYAAANGHTDIVALLLERGVNINSTSRLERTPLMWAANRGQDGTVKFLIEKGADIASKDRGGKTALMLAVERNNQSTAELIRSYIDRSDSKLMNNR